MPARGGDWGLLHEGSDPIVADVPTVHELVNYYTTMAQEITSEADVLRKIGEGDDSQFKGESADAVRKKSKEVAESLQRMSGRYDAIRDALTGYLPELETALTESAAALRDAEDASAAGARAGAMPDPGQGRAQDAPPLTDDEQGAIDAKARATSSAKDGADAAVARLRRAVDGVNAAGKAAASTIRAAWDDGLHDTLGDKIKAFFSKLLKILVKIFTYIGIALAALAILIPGVGMLTFMAAVAAAVTLVLNITLAGMGEGSWLDVITSAVGLVLVGVGAGLTKVASLAKTAGLGKGMQGFAKTNLDKIKKLQDVRAVAIKDTLRDPGALRTVTTINRHINRLTDARIATMGKNTLGGFKEKPNWWRPNRALWNDDKAKIRDVLSKDGKGWQWQRLMSVDRQIEMDAMKVAMKRDYGVDIAALPNWHKYAAGGRVVASWMNTFSYGQGIKPTGWGSDQERVPGYKDASGQLVHGF
ncbi:hypothetical protein BIU97_06330 [Curtobacterium sp. MCBA15_009]|uniref:hypothetical protein n=1 Tax=Curtobacterium sp. MCBA15_009 TaxID=1898737 RepID=UPI0008DD0EF8|nr:hypothetical protein [Curtobacterium sp. MCBA15_009]OII11505.1 hypothetical protein BIU97_06330 [Curtobacterium sp. MCBA15_009]